MDLVGIYRRLIRSHRGLRCLLRSQSLVIGLLCASLPGKQALGPVQVGISARRQGLILGQRRLVLLQLRLQGAIIERNEKIALLDHLSVLDGNGHDLAGDACIDVGDSRRRQEADGVTLDREIGDLRHRGCHGDGIAAGTLPTATSAIVAGSGLGRDFLFPERQHLPDFRGLGRPQIGPGSDDQNASDDPDECFVANRQCALSI